MAVRTVVLYPNPWLRVRCTDIDLDRDDWNKWATDLVDTLAANPGVGIAAPQVGIQKRLVVIDQTRFRNPPDEAGVRVLVNPRITFASGRTITREGCLSIPGYIGDTRRARRVQVAAVDTDRNSVELDERGFMAIALQHEIDHLDGILFLDRLANRREALRLRAA